ncbi:MAG: histidine-type phosphatase, partial [Prevotella sp.]|nr:histidine-type phosphatase [Prevotella sp.]
MKKLFILCVVWCCVLGMSAQTARDDFKRDTHLSASNYLAYPGPTQGQLTPAPEGKHPFYISHYGRHGSRYLINPTEYSRPLEILKAAADAGKLTPLGMDVLRRVKMICDESEGRLGELTPLGGLQHRQIARRMFERF